MRRALFFLPLPACLAPETGFTSDINGAVGVAATGAVTTPTTGTTSTAGTGPPPLDCESSGVVCVVAGIPGVAQYGPEGVPAIESALFFVLDVEFGPDGTMYIVDVLNHRIRQRDSDGLVWTVSGTGMVGDGPEGPALTAAWNHPSALAFDPNDPDTLYVGAFYNSRVNVVDLATSTLKWWAGTGARSFVDDVPCEDAAFDLVSSLTFDDAGVAYIFDQANQVIRQVGLDGVVHTIAGTKGAAGYNGDIGPFSETLFHASRGRTADPSNRGVFHDGRLYIVDTENNVVRVLDPVAEMVTKFAGTHIENPEDSVSDLIQDVKSAVGGYAGDGGPAIDAQLNRPRDLAFGASGELYIADTGNNCIRVVHTNGIIDTFAGTCDATFGCGDFVQGEFAGEPEPALDATFCQPHGVAVDAAGDVYVSDTYNHVVRRIKI